MYVEATFDGTEERLLKAIRRHCSDLPQNLSLKDTLCVLRQGRGLPAGQKILLILDQFEQWLHAHSEVNHLQTDLVQALRQCDGPRLQCVVMVRDDFWLAATRFMNALEVDLLQGQNMALADLFDLDHARKVLAAFGRSYGRLPEREREMSSSHRDFLEQAVKGLAEQGKVICVRLALFAEMMKSKPWTADTLRDVGGIQGIGVAFLEETFGPNTPHPNCRLHQQSARAVLAALLPEYGTDIRGQMRSYDQLMSASGCRSQHEFDQLMKLLDAELRLITPTDPEGNDPAAPETRPPPGQRYYQLTHDYLVTSLRDWLTQKQRSTRRGRAELRLEELAKWWSQQRDNHHLPSWWEYVTLNLLTARKGWTKTEREMMRKAGIVNGLRTASVAVVALSVGFLIQQIREHSQNEQIRTAVATMSNLRGPAVPEGLQGLDQFDSDRVVATIRAELPRANAAQRLALSYALARYDGPELELLTACIPTVPAAEFDNLLEAFSNAHDIALARLNDAASSPALQTAWRHRARLAILALYLGDPRQIAEMVQPAPNPIERTILIDEFHTWHGASASLAELVPWLENSDVRYALTLGLSGAEQLSDATKQAWTDVFREWYQRQPDAATHAATDLALRRWHDAAGLPPVDAPEQPGGDQHWYVNPVGMTLVKIPATAQNRFRPSQTDPETATPLAVPDSFWMSNREVTVQQFRAFMEDADYPQALKANGWRSESHNSRSPNHPVQRTDWFDALLFCNWLSAREGLSPYYEVYGYGEGASWSVIDESGPGYRVPTSAEWEHACRAGTSTRHFIGGLESLLPNYAVFRIDQAEACGSKFPSIWGLFDMHGNVTEHTYHTDADTGMSVVRFSGGNYGDGATYVKASSYHERSPYLRFHSNGFRVVRHLAAE